MLSRVASHDRMRDFVGKDAATDQSEFIVSMDSNVAVNPTTKQMSNNYDAKENVPSLSGAKRSGQPTGMQSSKRKAQNFLLMGAKNAKAARSARTAARVGCFEKSSKQNKLSNTGSGVPLSKVVRLKYVKGFTQAVSTPCCLEDLA